MKRYLLDTGPLAALLAGRQAAVSLITPWIERDEAATSILVYGEAIEHLKGHANYLEHQQALHVLLRGIPPYLVTFRIMERYADIRRSMRPPHGPGLIGDIDTLIAATALEHSLTIVTLDRDFQRVPGIRSMLIDVRNPTR